MAGCGWFRSAGRLGGHRRHQGVVFAVLLLMGLLPASAPAAGAAVEVPSVASSVGARHVRGLAQRSLAAATQPPDDVVPAQPPTQCEGCEELVAERSASSRTFADRDGSQVVVVSPVALHEQGADGWWREIDRDVVASGGGFENRSERFDLLLPRDLADGPVGVADGGREVSFSLRGAGGPGSAEGSTVTYAGVLDGVDVSYVAGPGRKG